MPRLAVVPRELAFVPFCGSAAISSGRLTRSMLRGGTWRRLFPDVYIQAAAFRPDDHRMWCDAVALMLESRYALDGLSAAFLWGVDLLPRTGVTVVSVSVSRCTRVRRHTRLAVRRTTFSAGDATTFGGIALTTPVRTAFDLGRRPDRTDAVVAVDALTHRRLVTREALTRYAAQRAGRPGVRRLRDLLPLVEPLTESPMETRLRLLLHDAGAPPPTAQHEVCDRQGRLIARVDLAYPQRVLAQVAAAIRERRRPLSARPTPARSSPPLHRRSGPARSGRRNG